MVKHIGRIALAVLVTLALGVGLTALAGPASARIRSTSSCASEQSAVAHFQHKVSKDKRKLKAAKRHHHKAAAKKARKHLKRDRRHLAAAQSAYSRCSQGQTSPAPASSPAPAQSNPVTDQCNAMAGQLTALDPSGSLATGAAAFCDLLGQLAAASPGTDPVTLCNQLAAQDPTHQLGQLCTGLGGASLPGTGTGTVGGTLADLCGQLAAQDPTGQLSQLCTGLGSLPL